MELNTDFSKRTVVHAGSIDWVSSPAGGVDRRMLDRIGDEVARATTIVRFAPGSKFPAHTHGGGEEFLVLDGVFQDEHGDFPVGSYIRNPPTTRHTPASEPGTTIFVKLWQMDADDRQDVKISPDQHRYQPAGDGREVMPLHQDANEDVRLERWAPGAQISLDATGGMEVLVLDGAFAEGGEDFVHQSWLRLPVGSASTAKAGPEGARVWVKSGHLRQTPTAPAV